MFMQSNGKALRESPPGLAEGRTDPPSGVDWYHATRAIARLSEAGSLDEIVHILRLCCRNAVGACGIVVVQRDGDECHCIAEDSVDLLWQGRRLAQHACVSGWAMLNRQPVGIADIYLDDRVPHAIYQPTCVKSVAMVPIGEDEPFAALGAYWAQTGHPLPEEMAVLQAIGRSASAAFARVQLLSGFIELKNGLEAELSECTRRLEEAQQAIVRAQKMELVGQLAGTVAHDINNLLLPIMMSLDRILHSGPQSTSIISHTQLAMETAEKAQALVQRLLAFIRGQPLQCAAIDLQALLNGMEPLLALSTGSHIRLEIDAPPGIPNILAERQQLEIAILNLVINARDAMPGGGKIVIGLSRSANGSFVRLYVKDEGSGMDEVTRTRVLEPYFTTKQSGSGTGLGLAMVHDMIQKTGGVIDIKSAMGAGTEISLWLPATSAITTWTPAIVRDEDTNAQKRMAIVVDDHALVRQGIAAALRDDGYEVTEVDSAEACLDHLNAGMRPDVIIADQHMPGMSGLDLAHEVYRSHRDMAFVLISGQDCHEPALFDIVRMTKPFRHHELQQSIDHARQRAGLSGATH